MAPAIILVRHGRPLIDPHAAPTSWTLSPDGLEDVARLAVRLKEFAPRAIISSPEPKASETAQIIAAELSLKVQFDPGLHEHKRPAQPFGTEEAFRERMARAFAEPNEPVAGGESLKQAGARLAAALALHRGRPLVAVTHGTVLSVFVAERSGLDAFALWRSLKLPEALVLNAAGGLVTRVS